MKKLFILPALMIGAAGASAEQYFQASLTPEIAIYSPATEIHGLALNLWGENPQHSLNLGFLNGSTGDSGGLSLALVNHAESYTGAMWGLVNVSENNFFGWQDGVVNISHGTFLGLQSGVINLAQDFQGVQLGVVNYSETLRGVQLGLINLARNNSWFQDFPDQLATGFPFVNWSF